MKTYEHSGTIGTSLILAPLISIVGAIILGCIYSYVVVWSPIAGYVSIIFLMGLGFGLLAVNGFAASVSKCRAPGFMKAVGLLSGVVALYSSWVFFEYALLSRGGGIEGLSPVELFLHPGGVWSVASDINETGWYSIFDMSPSGALLWGIWGIEAAVIVGAGYLGGSTALYDEVFCEDCNKWIKDGDQTLHLGAPEGSDHVSAGLPEGSVDWLTSLEPVAEGQLPTIRATLKNCSGCSHTTAVKVDVVIGTVDDDGDVDEEENELVPWSLTTAAEHQALVAKSEQRPA